MLLNTPGNAYKFHVFTSGMISICRGPAGPHSASYQSALVLFSVFVFGYDPQWTDWIRELPAGPSVCRLPLGLCRSLCRLPERALRVMLTHSGISTSQGAVRRV